MTLNLPSYNLKVYKNSEDGMPYIHDRLRNKYVALTPEEWVRQHYVNFLIEYRGYPSHLMANEVGIMQNDCHRRCDTIVYDSQAQPIAIVEYKSPKISLTAKVFDQIVRYNMVLNVECLMVSNGIKHYCCIIHDKTYHFLKDIPTYTALLASLNR